MSFLNGEAYAALAVPEGAWIIKDIIPVGGIVNLYGKEKDGKSFLVLSLAEAISNPKRSSFLGQSVLQHGPVSILQLDTSRPVWVERVNKMKELDPTFDLSNVYFADKDSEGIPFPFNILTDGSTLKAKLTSFKPILHVTDTLRDSHPGDENDAAVMRNVIVGFRAAVPSGCGNMIVSHRRKETQFDDDDLFNSQRGSSSITAAMDTVLSLKRIRNSNKGFLKFGGRSTEQMTIKILHCKETLQWILDPEEKRLIDTMQAIITEFPQDSMREWGRVLVKRMGKWKEEEMTDNAGFMHFKKKKEIFRYPSLRDGVGPEPQTQKLKKKPKESAGL